MRRYKLLLADDEDEVRQGIMNKIKWEDYGFEIVGGAENGREALEIAEMKLPDVLITDIRMPFMDGIQLSKIIREKYPAVKIVILTGFDEFEYARKAIQVSVTEYALKPISASELIEVLKKVKAKLDKEVAEKEDVTALRENYRKSLPILKEKFLTSLVTNNLDRAEIEEKCLNYGINLRGNSFVVTVIAIDSSQVKSIENSDSSDNNFLYEHLYGEKELVKFAVLNIVEEIVEKHTTYAAFLNNEQIVIIYASEEMERALFIKNILEELEELRQNIERFLKVSVTMGVGNVCDDITIINRSFDNAMMALDYKVLMENQRIIWIEDIEPKSIEKVVFDEAKEHMLTTAIKLGTKNEIDRAIDRITADLTYFNASFKEYQIYVIEVLTTILKAGRNLDVDFESIFGMKHNLYSELQNLKSKDEVADWFKKISTRISNSIVKGRQDSCELLVGKAKEYIKENYYNSDISVNAMCEYLHISSAYFSFIFKKETKQTFVNYLTQVRMDKAKELMKTSNMKTFEIAEKVGYSDSNYFSYSFKRKFGLSPSEYRSSF